MHAVHARQSPLSVFFRHCEIFRKIYFLKGSPSIFGCFPTEWMLKNPKGSPFQIFSALCDFFRDFFHQIFFTVQFFDVLQYFDVLQQWMLKNAKGSLF